MMGTFCICRHPERSEGSRWSSSTKTARTFRPRAVAFALFTIHYSLFTLLLTGCKVGPTYVRPIAPAPPAFKEADPNWQPAVPADTTARGDWWSIFADPALNALEPQVATANQSLKAAAANYTAARAAIRVARASLAPTLGIAPFAGSERDSAHSPYTNPLDNVNTGNYSVPGDISYEVDLWGRIRRNVTASREEAQATAADLQSALLSLQAELAVDYFEARSADAESKLLNDTVQQYAEALRVTTNRFEGGVAGKSDVSQAETQLEAAKVQASGIAITRAQYEHAIAILIGQPPAAYTLATAPLEATPPIIPPGLPSQLLERRPDVAAAERRTAEANERIGIARAAFFPTLSISGLVGFAGTSPANLFDASSITYALGPTLSQTFFDYGRRRGISEQAIANYTAAAANYQQSVLNAYQQVEDNLVALRVLTTEADQQRQATAAAKEAEQIFNNRYVGGVDTYLQVITAQTTALTNERNDIDIMRRRMDATVNLIKALGGGWNTTQLPNPQP